MHSFENLCFKLNKAHTQWRNILFAESVVTNRTSSSSTTSDSSQTWLTEVDVITVDFCWSMIASIVLPELFLFFSRASLYIFDFLL